jgi:hypothetical protein
VKQRFRPSTGAWFLVKQGQSVEKTDGSRLERQTAVGWINRRQSVCLTKNHHIQFDWHGEYLAILRETRVK